MTFQDNNEVISSSFRTFLDSANPLIYSVARVFINIRGSIVAEKELSSPSSSQLQPRSF